jgi:uncharacterized phage protein (TIGR02218 family)
MKTISAGLQTIFESDRFYMADLYALTLVSGTVVRLTSADVDVSFGGSSYLASGPAIERSSLNWRTGVEVDSLELTLYPHAEDTLAGLSWLRAIRQGVLDGAELTLSKAFLLDWTSSAEALTLFEGRVAGIDADRSKAVVTVNSHLELLDIEVPRQLYSPGCCLNLYDPDCAVVKATYTYSGTVGAGATASVIPVAGVDKYRGYFAYGYLSLSGGAVRRTIKEWAPGSPGFAKVAVPLYDIPAEGASVTLVAGCQKTLEVCRDKFSNLVHFRGFPYIPAPETAA